MTILPFTVDGRHGRYQEVGDGLIKMYFDDGEICYAIPSSMVQPSNAPAPKSSVTSDANPTGVNQFTGAAGVLSAKAVKASKGVKSPKGHVKAMEARQHRHHPAYSRGWCQAGWRRPGGMKAENAQEENAVFSGGGEQ